MPNLEEVIFANPGYLEYLTYLIYMAITAFVVMAISLLTRPKKTFGSRYPLVGKIKYIFLVISALACCLVALARPYLPRGGLDYRRGAVEVMVVIDTSLSMLAPDVGDFRLLTAKQAAHKLVTSGILQDGDKVGLYTFNENAVRSLYLAKDFERYLSGIERIKRPRAFLYEESIFFTNFPLVLEEVYQAIDDQDEAAGLEVPVANSNRLVFILSDGDDQTEDRKALLKVLKEYNLRELKIYPIAIGTTSGYGVTNILRWHGYKSGIDYKRYIDTELKGQKTRLNTQVLGLLKDQTGGRMFVMDDSADDPISFMRSVVSSHRSLTSSPIASDSRLELWKYCVLTALVLIFLMILIY